MTLFVDTNQIVWDSFGELEPPQPEWRDQIEYWQDYLEKFFHSNGMTYDPADDNIEQWLLADDRAPFSLMVRELLPRLPEDAGLDDTDAVLLAHWLPDLHMGTSVTNFVMHELGLKDCFGFAISDRGLSAPFFAFDTLYKSLRAQKRKGLLVIADQKHLLYKSDMVSKLNPRNAATVVRMDLDNTNGFAYCGYQRVARQDVDTARAAIDTAIAGFALPTENVSLIGPKSLLDAAEVAQAARIDTEESLICSAPFAAFAEVSDMSRDYVLLCEDERHITALGLKGRRS